MEKNKTNATKAMIALTIFSFLNKVLGLIRESALAAYFGASYDSDAYKLAYSIPSILLALISTSIATTFIPVYTDISSKKTILERDFFVSNFISIFAVLSIILSIMGFIFAPFVVKILAYGFTEQSYELTVELTKIMMILVVFTTMYNCFAGLQNANRKFYPPIIAWTVFDIIVFSAFVFFNRYGIKTIAIWTVFGSFAMLIIQIPSSIKSGYKFVFSMDFKEPGFKKILKLILPITFSSAFSQIYMFIDRMLASSLPEGSISALDYANRINWLIYNIFILSLLTVTFPELTLNAKKIEEFKYTLVKAIRSIWVIVIPGVVFLLVLAKPIIQLFFERGSFDSADTKITSLALMCYSIGSIGLGMRELFNRAFFAIQDTKTPVINGIIVVLINITLSIIFVKIWGVFGLASSVTIAYLGSGLLLGVSLSRKIGKFADSSLFILGVKLLIAGTIMGFSAFYSYKLFALVFTDCNIISQAIKLFISGIISLSIYILVLLIEKVKEVTIFIAFFRNKVLTKGRN